MASVGSQLITPFNAASRGANRGKNDHGIPLVFLLLSMEPSSYDSSIASTATGNGFTLRGLDALPNRASGVRAGSSFFNGLAASTTPSSLSSANRRQIAILNGVRNSPGKQFLQILVNDHPDGALSSAEGAAMRAAINAVMPAPANSPPVLTAPATHSILRNAVCSPAAISVSDAETPVNSITVSASSSDQLLLPNTAIMYAGSGANRDVKFTPAAGRTGSVIVTLTASDGVLTTQRQIALTVTDPYDTWAATQGLTAANRAALQDPDGDGQPNLLEYFHGSAPLLLDAGPSLEMHNGAPHFTFRRSRSAAFQPWVLEAGSNPGALVPWSPAEANILTTTAGDIDTLRVRLPTAGRWFVRLRVTR